MESEFRIYELKIDLPYLPKGNRYAFDFDTAFVYLVDDNGEVSQYPLRTGLASYLWLLQLDDDKYLEES
jgi:hypothetical protein